MPLLCTSHGMQDCKSSASLQALCHVRVGLCTSRSVIRMDPFQLSSSQSLLLFPGVPWLVWDPSGTSELEGKRSICLTFPHVKAVQSIFKKKKTYKNIMGSVPQTSHVIIYEMSKYNEWTF